MDPEADAGQRAKGFRCGRSAWDVLLFEAESDPGAVLYRDGDCVAVIEREAG